MDIKDLILFILNNSNPNMGVKKLNKLAFLLEWSYMFDKDKRKLTNANFVALEMGPEIDDYKNLFKQMISEKLIQENLQAEAGKIDYLPLVNSEEKIDDSTRLYLDAVLRKFQNLSAFELKKYTHDLDSYRITMLENNNKFGCKIDKELAQLEAVLSLDNLLDQENVRTNITL